MYFETSKQEDAQIIHRLMHQAFQEYHASEPPSTALEETVESIQNALNQGEQAIIAYEDHEPIAMVRFRYVNEGLYFYRLSVLPTKQGKGIAKKLVHQLEIFASERGVKQVFCKVRKDILRNIHLYQRLGYSVCQEERTNHPKLTIVTMSKKLSERRGYW
ncbi:GNAT family N-acetyltransferase [Halalkalibacter urbisdiaboli]|uniref:GNAT family N-acetyltransferase n=1 Tax=Halalkalibacter urbisdiaboli TaxID=1960589 RepID=UPI001FD99281|nr:GNAT family N-acetyltransferase [Halalkalibacter urbisdiaboli]